MKEIQLSGKKGLGKVALVDDEDYEKIILLSPWYLDNEYGAKKKYIKGSGYKNQKSIKYYIHRIVMDAQLGVSVDHINGDKLDNRKSNLRIVSHTQNMMNRKPRKNGISKYKGVTSSGHSKKNPWRATIINSGVIYRLGSFSTQEEAAFVYNEKAKKLHGEYAWLNVIE